ncbi:MAG: hypothetical protein LC792_30070 [Actinobacteria bacterium]|nr:hypothetical protein [Actinomycetota bacterium]
MLIVGLVVAGFFGARDSSMAVSTAAPPPPSAAIPPPAPSPGTHAIWPAGNADVLQGFQTPTDAARDFAIQALKIADPKVRDFAIQALKIADPKATESPEVSTSGIGSVTITLPTGQPLALLTQRHIQGNWIIIQVGDQSRLRGITMLPDGKPGPVMTIFPPTHAVSADVTEVAVDGTHRIQVGGDDLKAGVLHLADAPPSAGPWVYSVLIVYRDRSNNALDALGGTFA